MSIPRNTPQPVQDCPILQYASGRTEARTTPAARFAGLVGFHSEIGRDEALDRACHAAGVPQIEIRHPRSGAPSEVKPHWSFGESVRFHPITAGPPATTISGCLAGANAQRTAEAGIGLAWPAGEKSRMAVRGLIVVGDVPVLVQLSVRSTMTGYLLAALLDHARVCLAADGIVERVAHPDEIAFHELALPLRAGVEVSVGRGETTLITPFVSDHPAEITREYVRSVWRTKALHAAALAAWPGIVAWAAGYRSGETNGDSHLDAPPAADELEWTPPARPAAPTKARRRMEDVDLPL